MLIVVEGNQDKHFINLYLKYLEKNNIKIVISGGNKGLSNVKADLEQANKIKIIFDADNNFDEAKKNIEKQLNELKIDSKYEMFLLPNDKDNGTLEDLLKEIAKDKCVLRCFDCYFKCIEKLQEKNSKFKLPNKKDKIYAYFETFGYKPNKLEKLEHEKLEEALDFNSPYLEPLKNFLEN
ncbi:DUF3226 domain-containing protein [Helicobacter bilis]|uniref:DUF3226 domain-containing protein n=1 Tax=Helicobacter bilis TaxID=37372 RepID=UPI000CF11455|nr:DUF3226 domain-containing protein [Helicobacter bilis]